MSKKLDVFKMFELKYRRLSKELGKDVVAAKEYRDSKGGPTLKTIKERLGLTFFEAERKLGIKRTEKDMISSNKKVYNVGKKKITGKMWCERGSGKTINRSDCMRGCNDACHACKDAIRLKMPYDVDKDMILTKQDEADTKYNSESVLAAYV